MLIVLPFLIQFRKKRKLGYFNQNQQSSTSHKYEEEEPEYQEQLRLNQSSSHQTRAMDEENDKDDDDIESLRLLHQIFPGSSIFDLNQPSPPSSSSSSSSSTSSAFRPNPIEMVRYEILTSNNTKKDKPPPFILQKPNPISPPSNKKINQEVNKMKSSKKFTREAKMDMKGWVNGLSGSEAKTLFHLLSQRDDIDLVEESIDMMDNELGDLCSTFNSLEEEELNQLILDGNALDYQLKVGYEQANGLFRLLNTILRSLRSRRRNVKVSENFEKKMKIQIATILGIFGTNRMSGQCRPPYNLELSLNFKNLSKNQRRKFGTTGISNGIVEDKIWKNLFVNQICEETISIVKEALKEGFTFAAFLDNYAVIKQRGMKTSEIVSKSVQTITMMGLLIKFPISPTTSISPIINFNNISHPLQWYPHLQY